MNKTTTLFYAVLQKVTEPRFLTSALFVVPLIAAFLFRGSLDDVGGNPCGCTGG